MKKKRLRKKFRKFRFLFFFVQVISAETNTLLVCLWWGWNAWPTWNLEVFLIWLSVFCCCKLVAQWTYHQKAENTEKKLFEHWNLIQKMMGEKVWGRRERERERGEGMKIKWKSFFWWKKKEGGVVSEVKQMLDWQDTPNLIPFFSYLPSTNQVKLKISRSL